MSKSDRLYSKSPKVERDTDGEVKIKKPAEATKEDIGLSGNPLPETEGEGEMPIAVEQIHDRHQREMKDTHKRHEDEIKDMHKRHHKEISKAMGKDAEEDKGEGEISKVEETK